MSISIKDIMGLQSAEKFVLIAGKNGLANRVSYAKYINVGNEVSELKDLTGTFVLGESLDDLDMIVKTLKKIIGLGASGFALRINEEKSLPKEVIGLAESENFPLFVFGKETNLEEVIYHILNRTMTDHYLSVTESTIERMIEFELSHKEVAKITGSISTLLLKYAMVAYVYNKSATAFDVDRYISVFNAREDMKDKAGLRRYKNGLMIMITKNNMEKEKYLVTLKEITDLCGIKEEEMIISISDIHLTYEEINSCFRESYYAYLACKMDGISKAFYKDIGVYKLLIPNRKSDVQRKYMEELLEPILNNKELLETAIEFVRTGGDINKTADRIFCHKNTIRYRINKIHESLLPESEDLIFYENLSAAIKIYLINHT